MRRLAALPVLLALVLPSLAASSAEAAAPGPTYLSTLEAGKGSFVKRASGGYALRLRHVDRRGLYFTDRPLHQAGEDTTSSILAHFFKPGTGKPNAVVRVRGERKSRDTVIVELSHPRYSKSHRTLSFRARPLLSASRGLARFERYADSRLPRRFGATTLFIDLDSQECTVELSISGTAIMFQNVQTDRNYGDSIDLSWGDFGAGLIQYGTWDYGCGGTISGDVYTNAAPSGSNPTPGTKIGSFSFDYQDPEIGHNEADMNTQGSIQAQTDNPDPGGNQPVWMYTISSTN
jgi:hypothetical protein